MKCKEMLDKNAELEMKLKPFENINRFLKEELEKVNRGTANFAQNYDSLQQRAETLKQNAVLIHQKISSL